MVGGCLVSPGSRLVSGSCVLASVGSSPAEVRSHGRIQCISRGVLRLLRDEGWATLETRTIAHRELRNNSSAVLRAVQAGETVEISNHGEVVAVLVPPQHRSLDSLRVRKATVTGGFSTLPRVRLDRRVQESLDDLRGDR